MYYNKLFGLRFLEKALIGVEGVKTPKYQTYLEPEEFSASHVPEGTKRLLLRGNYYGDIPPAYWHYAPREEVDNVYQLSERELTLEVRKKIAKMKLNADRARLIKDVSPEATAIKPPNTNVLQTIMVPLKERSEYPVNGRILVTPKLAFLELRTPNASQKYWRNSDVARVAFTLMTKNALLKSLQSAGLSFEESLSVSKRLTQAFSKIRTRVESEKILKGKDVWEASFTVEKNNQHLEFYDFLRKPKHNVADERMIRSVKR